MIDIEKLKAENDARMVAALENNRICAALPVPPKQVHFANERVPWVCYEVDYLPDALEIMKKFVLHPWRIGRGSSCTFGPPEQFDLPYYKRGYTSFTDVTDGAPYFESLALEGQSTEEMVFYTKILEHVLRVTIKIRHCPIRAILRRIEHPGRRGAKFVKDSMHIQGAAVISWGYGADACSLTYWFPDLPSFWLGIDDVSMRDS